MARHVSDLNGSSSGAFTSCMLQIWYVVICVLDTSGCYAVFLQLHNIRDVSSSTQITTYQICTNVCKKTSLSRYYTLCFCIKQYDFQLLIYSQPPVVRHFTNWWHLSYFPWTIAFIRTFATSILWCYRFNGMLKLYDISCATLYIARWYTVHTM